MSSWPSSWRSVGGRASARRMVLADGLDASPPRESGTAPRSPRCREISRAIPDDSTAVVEYVRGQAGSATTVFVVTRAGRQARQIPPAPSWPPGPALHWPARGGAHPDSLGRDPGARLLEPVLAGLPAAVVRAGHRARCRPARSSLRGLGSRQAGHRAFAVSYAPSASPLARLWQRPRQPVPAGHCCRSATRASPIEPNRVSQAEHYLGVRGNAGSAGSGPPRRSPPVAGYADRAEVRLRGNASEAELKRAGLARYRVVHLATHALVDDRSIARTRARTRPLDGRMAS